MKQFPFPFRFLLAACVGMAAFFGFAGTTPASLRAMLRDLSETYGAAFPEGKALLAKAEALKDNAPPEAVEALALEAAKAHPLLRGKRLAFVARHQYAPDHHNTHTMFPSAEGEINSGRYRGGGAIRTLDLATGAVTTLEEDADGVYRDLEVSYDGSTLLYAYRPDPKGNSSIYVRPLAGGPPRRLTWMATADDMDPTELPDGRIVFASTRDPKYVMCNRHISANLYRMNPDGSGIVKIANSTLFERPTDVLPDGRVLYDRWEYNDRDFGSAQGLWTVAPDGTRPATYYGNNSPVGAAVDGRTVPGSPLVAMTLTSTHDRPWGALALMDRSKGVDGRAPIVRTWPEEMKARIREPGTPNDIDAYTRMRLKYEDPRPLSEKYLLASRQLAGKGEKTGLFLLDVFGNETLLYEEKGPLGAFDATVLAPRAKPATLVEARDYADRPGSFLVQDVYIGTHMAGVRRGEAKTLRIVESCPKRYISQKEQWAGEGQQNPGVNWHSFEVKRVLGEVPIHPDGSAWFEVPQDAFVYFQVLDAEGRMIQSMRSGTQVQSGEAASCVGCHENRTAAPPPPSAPAMALSQGKPAKPLKRTMDFAARTDRLEADAARPTFNFITDVQPIFTARCVSCHGYEAPAGGLTLVPDKNTVFNAAYVDLWRTRGRKGVRHGNLLGAIGGGQTEFSPAKGWGSFASPLIRKLTQDDAHRDLLTPAEVRRVMEWVDLNAPYYGDYATNYGQNPGGRSPLSWQEHAALGIGWHLGHTGREPAPIYFDNPEKSPGLRKLPAEKREAAIALIRKGLERLRANPDIDWRGLSAVPGNPALSVAPWKPCPLDAWRLRKTELRAAIEAENRKALREGRTRTDRDNAADWEPGFPGWPK